MATVLTLGKRPGDWLRSEAPAQMSREIRTVLTGNNIKSGDVCCEDTALDGNGKPKIKLVPGTGNEKHTYTPTGTATAGTFTLTLWNDLVKEWVTTTPLDWDAELSEIDDAVQTAIGAAATTAMTGGTTGVPITAIDITFAGTGYAGKSMPLGQCNFENVRGWTAVTPSRATSAGAAQNEVQTIAIGGSISAGGGGIKIGFKIGGAWLWTDLVEHNATFSTVITNLNAAFDALLGASKVVASGSAWTALALTFSGSGYAGLAQDLVQVDPGLLSGATTVTVTRTTAGGKAGNRVGGLAMCIPMEDVDATSADVEGVFIVRDAVVFKEGLTFGGADPDAAAEALEDARIFVRSRGNKLLIPTTY